MSEIRILDAYLDKGILQLGGADDRFVKITRAATNFGDWLAAHPEHFVSCLFSAIDEKSRPHDPIRKKAEEHLKEEWRTYTGAFDGRPELIFRAMMMDAVQHMTDNDDAARTATALLLDATLPHIKLGVEGTILSEFSDDLRSDVRARAEKAWSVPADVNIGPFPNAGGSKVKVVISGTTFDQDDLETALFAASAPADKDGTATSGNPNLPNQNQAWVNEFVPRVAAAIGEPLQKLAKGRTLTLNAEDLTELVKGSVESYVNKAVEAIAASAHGLDLRTRLLWWKEAKVSPTTGGAYRGLETIQSTILMAYDYQSYLPAAAPPSVIAFLQETVRDIVSDSDEMTLDAIITSVKSDDILKRAIGIKKPGLEGATGPLVSILFSGSANAEILQQIVIDADTKLTPIELATLLYCEIQGLKASHNIVAREPENPSEEED